MKMQKLFPFIPKRNFDIIDIFDSNIENKPELYKNNAHTPKGKSDGITILLHIKSPFTAPFVLFSGKIKIKDINISAIIVAATFLIFIQSPLKYMNIK